MSKEKFLQLSPSEQSRIIIEEGILRAEKKRGSRRVATYRVYDFDVDIEFRK
jgi:hypothetical protein